MSGIFDAIHRELFDQMFGSNPEARDQLAQIARDQGASEEEIAEIMSGRLRVGHGYGGMHEGDIGRLVARALFGERARSITLKISRQPRDEAGHLEVQIVDIERGPVASDQEFYTRALLHVQELYPNQIPNRINRLLRNDEVTEIDCRRLACATIDELEHYERTGEWNP